MKKSITLICFLAFFSTISLAQDARQLTDLQFMYKCAYSYNIQSSLISPQQSVEAAQVMAKSWHGAAFYMGKSQGISSDKMMQIDKEVDDDMKIWIKQQIAKKMQKSDVGAILETTIDKCTEKIKRDPLTLKFVEAELKKIKTK